MSQTSKSGGRAKAGWSHWRLRILLHWTFGEGSTAQAVQGFGGQSSVFILAQYDTSRKQKLKRFLQAQSAWSYCTGSVTLTQGELPIYSHQKHKPNTNIWSWEEISLCSHTITQFIVTDISSHLLQNYHQLHISWFGEPHQNSSTWSFFFSSGSRTCKGCTNKTLFSAAENVNDKSTFPD